ncbi:MAG: hypothetical protein IPM57_12135 [Oligoflexia bacterium]|nr:hypothetical protein [Oligoflexia bacterium]
MSQLLLLKEELLQRGDLELELEKILQKFYTVMANDSMIGFFFQGKDLNKIVNGQKELLLTAMGIKPTYTGRPVNQAHMNLPPILEGHFNRRLVILEQTLNEFKLRKDTVQNWIGFEKKFANVIVK